MDGWTTAGLQIHVDADDALSPFHQRASHMTWVGEGLKEERSCAMAGDSVTC